MKAVAIEACDAPVRLLDMPPPRLGPGEVRIAVHAAGLNPADWKLAEGWLRDAFTPRFPYALGFDAAGMVLDCAPDVQGLAPGARVVAKTAVARGGAGALAEQTVAPAPMVCPLPDAIGFVEAAALPTAGITAWEALFDTGRLAAGQTMLVNGGAGGTGSIAIQLARMAGAHVIATASPANHDYLIGLGAELALDYRRPDLAAAVRAHSPQGVDLLLDTVGQGKLADPLAMIRDRGRFVTIGTLVRGEPRPAPQRGIAILTAMSSRLREAGQLRLLVDAMAKGALAPPAIETLPPTRAAEGLERLRQGHVRGKLVLVPNGGGWA